MKRLILISLILVFGLLALASLRVETRERTHNSWALAYVSSRDDRATPRGTEAEARFSKTEPGVRTVVGRVSATEERARADALRQLEAEVSEWLEPEVPASWRPDRRQLDDMIVDVEITPTEKPYGTVHTAELDADFSNARRAELVDSYERVVVLDRMLKLGGLLLFVLICLAAVSAYIRADEATKGYQTTRLRLLTAAGVGAAGVLIYQLLV